MDDFDDLLDNGPGDAMYSEEEDFDEYDDLEDDLGDDADSHDDESAEDEGSTSRLTTLLLGAAAGASLVHAALSAPARSRLIRQYLPGLQRLEPATGRVTHVFQLSAEPNAATIRCFEGLRSRTTYRVTFSRDRLTITCRAQVLEHAVAEVIADLESAWASEMGRG
jgi:hypothetical protein